jgi:PAS domain S-box-containing protein
MFVWWGKELTTIYNDSYKIIAGDKHPGLLGKSGREAWAEIWEDLAPLVEKVFNGASTWSEDLLLYINRRGFAEETYFTFSYSPILNDFGAVGGLFCAVVETTEKVVSKKKLAESEVRFRNMVKQASVSMMLTRGMDVVIESINAPMLLFLGEKSEEEVLGRKMVEVSPELEGQPGLAIVKKVAATGEAFNAHQVPVQLYIDGRLTERFFDLSYTAIRDESGETGVLHVAMDVTAQVQARQERESQQRRLAEVFEQAPVAIFVLRGAEYVLEVVNPAMGEMLGAVPGRILGRRYMEEFPGLAGQGYKDLLDGVWHSGREYVAHEQAARLPHHGPGETGFYNFTYVPLREAEGSVAGIMCVAVDVTAQVLARRQVQQLNQELAAINEELAAANEELRAANEEIQASNEELAGSNGQLLRTNADLDNFIYTASHDLKAPISNIEGLLQALLRSLSPQSLASERVQGITGRMQVSVERFKKTIGNLTEVVKLQKEYSGERTLVSLPEMIGEVMLDLEPMIRSAGAEITKDVAECPQVRFSEKNLRSVVYNLVSNALKYRSLDRVPLVRITCRTMAGYHVLTVSDNGLGMEEGRMGQLFTMFKRFHDHVEGSGIGLYMVKKIIDNAGGKIEVESRSGEGSTFRVYLPA